MADNTIASFLVSLGWKLDEPSQKKFQDTVAKTEKTLTESDKRIGEGQRKQAKETAEGFAFAVTKLNLVVQAAAEAGRAIGRALTDTVGGFERLYFVSGRTGASVANLKAIGYAFSQVGGSTQQAVAAVESFSHAMRTNAGLRGFVRDLGVDQTKDTVEQIADTVAALQKSGYEVGSQQAAMLGIDEATYNIHVKKGEALKRYNDEYKKTARDVGLNSEQAGKASAEFMQSLGSLYAKLEAIFDKLLTDRLPQINIVLENIGRWFQNHMPEIGDFIQKASGYLSQFLDWIGKVFNALKEGIESGAIQKGFSEFVESTKRLADNFERIVKTISPLLGLFDKMRDLGFGGVTTSILGGVGGGRGGGVLGLGTIGGSNALVGGGPTGTGGGGDGVLDRAKAFYKRHAPTWAGGDSGGKSGGAGIPGIPDSVPMTEAERNTLGLIMKYESHGKNTMNYAGKAQGLDPNTAKGYTAQGYFQMLNSNWRRIAPGLGITTTNAMSSSLEDQTKVALHLLRNGGVGNWSNYNPSLRAALARGEKAPVGGTPDAGGNGDIAAGGIHEGLAALRDRMRETGEIKRFTAFNDEFHRQKAPGSKHVSGLAMDGVGDPDAIMKAYRDEMKKAGLAEGKDFYLQDEYRNPSKNSTGGHVHFDFRHGGAAEVYQAYRAKQARERGEKPVGARGVPSLFGAELPPGGNPADAIKAPPMGTGRQSFNSSSDNRAVHQTNNYQVKFDGAPDPHRHAHVFEQAARRTNQINLENVQSAIA